VTKREDRLVAKMMDFGYSTIGVDEHIRLPISEPWQAPEWEKGRGWRKNEAKRMDVFSFGMVCVWLLFEPYLSSSLGLPPDVGQWANDFFDEDGVRETIKTIKEMEHLIILTEQMLRLLLPNDDRATAEWVEFFRVALSSTQEERELGDTRLFYQGNIST
jgi:hypothetical protein